MNDLKNTNNKENNIYFGGGIETKKVKNIKKNPAVVVHSESAKNVVIIKGFAEEVVDPELMNQLDNKYEEKYGIQHGLTM